MRRLDAVGFSREDLELLSKDEIIDQFLALVNGYNYAIQEVDKCLHFMGNLSHFHTSIEAEDEHED